MKALKWLTFTQILLFPSLCLGKFVDVLKNVSPTPLYVSNYTSAIPANNHVFTLFYVNHHFCRQKAGVLEKAINEVRQMHENFKMYRVEGPYNPEIIQNETEVESYPSLAYYYPGEVKATDIFKGKWTIEGLKQWISVIVGGGYKEDTGCKCEDKGKIEKMALEKFHEEVAVDLTKENKNTEEALKLIKSVALEESTGSSWGGIAYNLVVGLVIGWLLGYAMELRKKEAVVCVD